MLVILHPSIINFQKQNYNYGLMLAYAEDHMSPPKANCIDLMYQLLVPDVSKIFCIGFGMHRMCTLGIIFSIRKFAGPLKNS